MIKTNPFFDFASASLSVLRHAVSPYPLEIIGLGKDAEAWAMNLGEHQNHGTFSGGGGGGGGGGGDVEIAMLLGEIREHNQLMRLSEIQRKHYLPPPTPDDKEAAAATTDGTTTATTDATIPRKKPDLDLADPKDARLLMQRCCTNIFLAGALVDGLEVVKAYNGLYVKSLLYMLVVLVVYLPVPTTL